MKEIFISRGLPGSGKTTHMSRFAPQAIVCSADHFFQKSGTYLYDKSKIGEAQQFCWKEVLEAIKNNAQQIVVDNTHAQIWQFENFITLADIMEYLVQVFEIPCENEDQVWAYWARNTHKAPISFCLQLWKKWEKSTNVITVNYKAPETPKRILVSQIEDLGGWQSEVVYEMAEGYSDLAFAGIKKAYKVGNNWFDLKHEMEWDSDVLMSYEMAVPL